MPHILCPLYKCVSSINQLVVPYMLFFIKFIKFLVKRDMLHGI